MPTVKLFSQPLNPFSEKVACALALKEVAYLRVEVTDSNEIKRLNPEEQTLPVLEIDGRRIGGSAEILRWLEDLYPTHSLFSRDFKIRKQQESLAEWSDSSFAFYWNRWLRASEENQRHLANHTPGLLARIHQHVEERMGIESEQDPENIPGVRKIVEELSDRMADLVGFLGSRRYFFSDQLSIADLSVFGMLLLMRHGPMPRSAALLEARPTLVAHTDRLTELSIQGSGGRRFAWDERA